MFNSNVFGHVARLLNAGATVIAVNGTPCHVTKTPVQGLRKVEFEDQGKRYIALEQNPNKTSEWSAKARAGEKVVQFKEGDRYVAVAVNGQVKPY